MARIFLCHASEDKAHVREVYHRLRAIDGFEPWLDEEDLLPGQDWAREISRALQTSDFILVFFSRLSVAKHGYVQREMKLALDALQELPEGTIHTIPVRLDDCEVPASFQHYHYANLFAPDGFNRIVRAIRAELSQRPPELSQRPHSLTRQFLDKAGFVIEPIDPSGFLCTSDMPLWADLSPLYVRLVLDRALDLKEFQVMCAVAEKVYSEDVRGHTALVVIDRLPRAGDLHQIFALRAQQGFTIIPLPQSLMVQARRDGCEIETLKGQVELYTGRKDLYEVSTAVTDALSFFGRGALLADLQRRLMNSQSVAIFGARKMGKSSLVGRLREESSWPVALVDLQFYVGEGLYYIYGEVIRSWLTSTQVAFPNVPLSEWLENSSAMESTTLQAQVFRQKVEKLLELLAKQSKKPGLILCLDEIDLLMERPEYLEFAAVLRSIAEAPRNKGRFAMLVAGLEPNINRRDRMKGLRNPFYAFFNEIPLGPLELEDACTLIDSIGGQMGISYEDKALDFLAKLGGGHPFLTRQLCSSTIRGLERPATVTLERASQAVEDYLHRSRNYLAESLWGIDSGGPPPVEATLLQLLAANQPKPEEELIPSHLSSADKRVWQMALDHLSDQSLIRRTETGWKFTIPLYRHWIQRYILDQPEED